MAVHRRRHHGRRHHPTSANTTRVASPGRTARCWGRPCECFDRRAVLPRALAASWAELGSAEHSLIHGTSAAAPRVRMRHASQRGGPLIGSNSAIPACSGRALRSPSGSAGPAGGDDQVERDGCAGARPGAAVHSPRSSRPTQRPAPPRRSTGLTPMLPAAIAPAWTLRPTREPATKIGSQNRTPPLPESGQTDQHKSPYPRVRALTCGFELAVLGLNQ